MSFGVKNMTIRTIGYSGYSAIVRKSNSIYGTDEPSDYRVEPDIAELICSVTTNSRSNEVIA